ncbi:MAG: terminase large subunit [Colwellia sp.]|nr:terminase large subunit [Colwellia sp.]
MKFNIEDYAFPELEPGDQDWRWCHRYCYDILKGNIIAGKYIKQAAKRHFDDLQNDKFYFDEESAKSIVLWFKFIPITDGIHAGKPTKLSPSQIWICCSLIAWKWSNDIFEELEGINVQTRYKGTRRYSQAFILVARKYGKTTLAAGIKLYLLYKAGHRPRAFSLATKRDQAKEVWDTAKEMIRLSPRLSQTFEVRANDILLPGKAGYYKPLASDSKSLDGLNPTCASLDECHAIKDRNLYGVIVSAFGTQIEYLMLVITTAGFILDGLCTDLLKNGERTLNPRDKTRQDNYFYAMFTLDMKGKNKDDWTNSKNWFKSNPDLVYGRPLIKVIRDQFQEACLSTEEKANFLTKQCNIFVSSADQWLDITEVKANHSPGLDIDDPFYKGRKCYVAIDRARIHDICSFAILFPTDNGGLDVFWINLLPQKTIDNVNDYLKSVYKKALDSGDLRSVNTATVTDEEVKKVCGELKEKFDPESFSYDPWHMREICEDLEEIGYPMIAVSQGTGNMSEPAKKLEGLIKLVLLRYDSVLFEYACGCAMMNMTRKNNMEVYRENDKVDKIDPLIALIIGLSAATLFKVAKNIYDERGMHSV